MSQAAVYGLRGATGQGSGTSGTNPFVVGRIETTTPFSGTRLLEDGAQLSTAIRDRDWLSASLAGAAGIADAVSFALNPIAGIVAMGVGWILDHIEPLKSWLNDLTGDAGAVAGGAATWANIATSLTTAATDLTRSLNTTLAQVTSQAVDAYTRLMSDVAAHLDMAQQLATAINTGLTIAASIVQLVHDLVRDAIADVIGLAVSCIIPLPNVIADVVAKVAKWVTRIGTKIRGLVTSFDNLNHLFHRADNLLATLRSVFNKIALPFNKLDDLTHHLGAGLGDDIKKLLGGLDDLPDSKTANLIATNPRFADGEAYQTNCVHCTASYEMRERGLDVTASPLPDSMLPDGGRSPYDTLSQFTDSAGNPRYFSSAPDPDAVTAAIKADWPDGARGWCTVQWDGGGGHIFSVEKHDGLVVYVDPQTGGAFDPADFDFVDPNRPIAYVRVDDLDMTGDLDDFMTRKEP